MSDTDNPDNPQGTPRLRSVRDDAPSDDVFPDDGDPIDGDNLFSGRPVRSADDPNRYGRIERVDPNIGLDQDRGDMADHDAGGPLDDDGIEIGDDIALGDERFDRPVVGIVADEPSDALDADPFADSSDSTDTGLRPWTEEPTGQVPHALLSDDLDAPSTAGSGRARWRGDATSDFEADDFDDIADLRDDVPVGESDAVADFFSFDEMDETVQNSRNKLLDMDQPAPIEGAALASEVDRPAVTQAAPRERLAPGAAVAGGGRNMPMAIAVGVGLAVLAFLAFRAGPAVTMILVALIGTLASVEFFAAARRGGHHPATLLGIVASVSLPLATYWKGPDAFPLVLGLTIMFGLLWYLIGVEFERPAPNLGITMLGVGYVGVLVSFAALILRGDNGTNVLLAAVIATVGYDVGAYFVGRNAGRSPLSVASPNKTVEGLLGGCFTAVLAAVLFVSDLLPFGDGIAPFARFADALLLGVVVALVAPLGDLAESLLKRDFGVKDMGALLPGHGGVLDRFDGLLFVLPAAYYLSNIIG